MHKFISQKLAKVTTIVALTALSTFTQAQTINWQQAGPIYTAGRIRCMIIDKADVTGNTLYAGSTTSGLFLSTNGGTNWSGLQSTVANRVVSYMAQATDNTIYVATGEGFLRASERAKAQSGSGLYKVASGALVQVAPASVTGTVITKVACSPINPSIIAIAGSNGVLISFNGGSSFTPAAGLPTFTNTVKGQDLKFNNSGILYFSIGNENGNFPSISDNENSKIYRSTDATLTNFQDKTPTTSMLSSIGILNFGRIELAIAPSNNNVIYASCANKFISPNSTSSSTKAFIVSYDGGDNWVLISVGAAQLDALGNGGTTTSGDRAHCIVVNPTNSDQVLIGSFQLYAWTRNNGSQTNPIGFWNKIGTHLIPNFQLYIHENIHDIKQTTAGGLKYYIVTDAGIFKSTDNLLTFQPFYNGIVTGQFNTVSIERFPIGNIPSVAGSSVNPFIGFMGGTTNAGLNYFSGNYPSVTLERSFIGGEINEVEFSKILPNVAYASSANGRLYLNSDIKNGDFIQKDFTQNTFNATGGLTGQVVLPFVNPNYATAGTPFKMWENYGQISTTFTSNGTPDSLIFYNDSLRFAASFLGAATLSTQTVFNWQAPRPNKFALIDSIVVRTGTVQLPAGTTNSPAYAGNNNQRIHIATPAYTVTPASLTNTVPITISSLTVLSSQGSGTAFISPPTSSIATINNTITLNQSNLTDNITVTFSTAPFAAFTATTTNPAYYRVFCTVFYKYSIGDVVQVVDNSISTKTFTYNITATKNLSWRNRSNITSTVSAVIQDSVKKRNVLKTPSVLSSRLAFVWKRDRIYVSTQPLSLNDPISYVCVSGSGALTCDATGAKTNSVIIIPGKPTILEWSKTGLELYYATDANQLYRVSYIHTLLDSTSRNYNGKLHSGVFKFLTGAINTSSPYRTTLLGTFTTNITSISIAESNTLMTVTFNDPFGAPVMTSTNDVSKSNFSNIGLISSTGNLVTSSGANGAKVNCSLIEATPPYKQAFVGTDIGLFHTPDITTTSPIWSATTNSNLPTAQIFDIKQQTLKSFECYNSGQIYVATNGRGVWFTSNFFSPNIVSVNENKLSKKAENNLSLYPNPTNGEVMINFNAFDNETVAINIMDVTGKIVLTQYLGKLYTGQVSAPVDASSLPSGIYIVNVTSNSNIKRVAKLIVTK